MPHMRMHGRGGRGHGRGGRSGDGAAPGAAPGAGEGAGGERVSWLDPSAVRLYRDAAGNVRATVSPSTGDASTPAPSSSTGDRETLGRGFRQGPSSSGPADQPAETPPTEGARSRSILRPALFRAFPITSPGSYVELREEGGKSVGMLRSLASLGRESRKIAEELLRERYLVPVIRRIVDLRHEFGAWLWEVETDRGERTFTMKSPRDDVKQTKGGRVRVTDIHGNTYEVTDLAALDARSRSLFGKIA